MSWGDWILHFSSHVEELVNQATESAWIYVWVFAMSLIDGVIPIVPSETIVIATASTWTQERGVPWLLGVWLAAAAGAWCGDQLTYQIGTKIHIRSLRLFRGPRGQRTLDWAEHALIHRGAAFIIAARFIPFGRVAVNLTAGALKFNRRRFMILDAIAAVIWATYAVAIGLSAAALFKNNQLLSIAVGVAGGLLLGWLVDRLLARFGVKVPDVDAQPADAVTEASAVDATATDPAASDTDA